MTEVINAPTRPAAPRATPEAVAAGLGLAGVLAESDSALIGSDRSGQVRRQRVSTRTPARGQHQTQQHADAAGQTDRQQWALAHGLFDAGPQIGIELIEQVFELLLERLEHIGKAMGLLAGHLQQVLQLQGDRRHGLTGLLGDHLGHVIEAASGGLQGLPGHLGPLALNGGKEGLEALPELLLGSARCGGGMRVHWQPLVHTS